MPKFQTGNPGRPKGARNKSTLLIRDRIQGLFDTNFETIQDDLESLEPKDRLKFLSDLLPYLAPKLQSTNYSQTLDLDNLNEEEINVLIKNVINEQG
jgi:hypothetical protein